MTFKPGDKVICVKYMTRPHYTNPMIGGVYEVDVPHYDGTCDKITFVDNDASWFYSSQFILLEHCTPFIKALYVEKS